MSRHVTRIAAAFSLAIVLFGALSVLHMSPARAYIECSVQSWRVKDQQNNGNWNGYNMTETLYFGYDSHDGVYCGDMYGTVNVSLGAFKTGGTAYSYINVDNVTHNGPTHGIIANDSSSQNFTITTAVYGGNCGYVEGKIVLSTGATDWVFGNQFCQAG